MSLHKLCHLAFELLSHGSAQAQDGLALRDYPDLVERPTLIEVLGSTRFDAAPTDWDPSVLAPLLDLLAEFEPDAILIEALPSESIDTLWRFREDYPGVARTYARQSLRFAAAAQIEIGLDMAQARAALRYRLSEVPVDPTPSWRKRTIVLFLAAGDPYSAWIQWLQLPEGERSAGGDLTRNLVDGLEEFGSSRNESITIAATLAARLGLELVYPIDDHASDDLEIRYTQQLGEWIGNSEVKSILSDPRFAATRDTSQRVGSSEELLDTYRVLSRDWGSADAAVIDAYLRFALARGDEQALVAKTHLASLEARNLRQAANIREVLGDYPGGKILVIIGSAHLPWLVSMLGDRPDIHLISGDELLR